MRTEQMPGDPQAKAPEADSQQVKAAPQASEAAPQEAETAPQKTETAPQASEAAPQGAEKPAEKDARERLAPNDPADAELWVDPDDFTSPVLFILQFPIRLKDYLEFHRVMSAGVLRTKRRQAMGLGIAEVVLALVYVFLSLTGATAPLGSFQWVLVGVLLVMGGYSIVAGGIFGQTPFQQRLINHYQRSHLKDTKLTMEFHEDGIEETTGGRQIITWFGKMHSLVVTPTLYILRVDAQRNVLIPREPLGPMDAQVGALLDRAVQRYGKQRVER